MHRHPTRCGVLIELDGPDVTAFTQEIVERVGNSDGVEDLDRWLQLAMNIWNTTPQPDRGGKSAYELSRRRSSCFEDFLPIPRSAGEEGFEPSVG